MAGQSSSSGSDPAALQKTFIEKGSENQSCLRALEILGSAVLSRPVSPFSPNCLIPMRRLREADLPSRQVTVAVLLRSARVSSLSIRVSPYIHRTLEGVVAFAVKGGDLAAYG